MLSCSVPVPRGIRQGCPISGQLYSIAMEPLLCRLRSRLRGLSLPGLAHNPPVVVSAYAGGPEPPKHNQWGVGIVFSKGFTPESLDVEQVVEGRLRVVRATFEQFNFDFINGYAPVSGLDRVCFLKVFDTV